MAENKQPVLVVLQLSGGNDYLNTIIPYANSLYWENRPAVSIPEDQIIPIDHALGLHPSMEALKPFYDDGNMAVIHGVGYADSPRSHFRSMDIWHTCEPDIVGTEGWLGRALRDIDPNKENVVTGVSFGPSMYRAMALPGVPVACVSGDLETYGMLPGIEEQRRQKVLERFKNAYAPAIGLGAVMDYMGQTGLDSMAGADILKVAPQGYQSSVAYPDSKVAASCAAWPRCTRLTWGPGSSTSITGVLTPMPVSLVNMPSCGARFPKGWALSSPICGNTRLQITS